MISLQATNLPPESNGRAWYELRSPFSVGSMWSSGETRRWDWSPSISEGPRRKTATAVILLSVTWGVVESSLVRWNLPEGEVRSFRYWRLNFHETMGGGGTVYKVHVSEVGDGLILQC